MIYELLQKWAKVTPNAFAVAAPDRPPLTYGRLLCHVDQTIKALHAMGVGTWGPLCDRSVPMTPKWLWLCLGRGQFRHERAAQPQLSVE